MSAERIREVQYTSEWTDAPTNTVPDWTNAKVVSGSPVLTTISVPALGGTAYAVRTRVSDVYGQSSEWSTHTKHTTLAGPDGKQTINLENTPATVIVDDDGLTVEDGAIIIKDAYGSVVLTSTGFGTSWLDFIAVGLQNYAFDVGPVGAITVPSPDADTTTLPYWAFVALNGDPLLERRANALSPSGYSLRVKFSAQDDEFYLGSNATSEVSGVPVTPLSWYSLEVLMSMHQVAAGGGRPRITALISFLDGALNPTRTEEIAVYENFTTGTFDVDNYLLVAESPIQTTNDEHYCYVDIFVDELDGHDAANYVDIHSVALRDGVSETQLQQDLSLNSLYLRGDGAGNALHVLGPAYIMDTLLADSDLEVTGDVFAAGVNINSEPVNSARRSGNLNLLWNGGFRHSGLGWSYYANGDSAAVWGMFDTGSTTWTLRDGDHPAYDTVTGPYGSTPYLMSTSSGTYEPFIQSGKMAVQEGEKYSLSVLFGIHRCTGAYASIWWYDKDGTFISADVVEATAYDIANKTGGTARSGYAEQKINGAVAPSGATSAEIIIVMRTPKTSGSDCYLFIDQVNFTKTAFAIPYEVPPQQGWNAPTLGNSWVNYGGSYSTAGWYIDRGGFVHLKGLIKDGTIDTAAFTLPVGARPALHLHFAANSYGAFGSVRVENDGDVWVVGGDTRWVSLDGITFLADGGW